MIYFASFFDDAISGVGGVVFDGLRSLCYWLDTTIYNLIIYVYNWFVMLCNGRLLNSATDGIDIMGTIAHRFSLILGVFMFFIVAISVIRMILEPDKINDKEMGVGSIVKRVILVVVMLGLSNNAFDLLYEFQSIVLGNNKSGTNVIQNLLSPRIIKSQDFGAILSANLLTGFYDVDEDFEEMVSGSQEQDFQDCANYNLVLRSQIVNNHTFDFGYNCLNLRTDVQLLNSGGMTESVYVMKFMSIESVVVGLFILYMLFLYCIKVGVRMVQLAFLELLSPMAIISYLVPKKDTMFDRWKNIYISTYIDVFIRMAVINLVILIISVILEGMYGGSSAFWSSISATNTKTKLFMVVIMICALLTFAKRAPDLLKEILPKGGAGSIGFGIGAKDNAGAMMGLGAASGLLIGTAGRLPEAIGDISRAKGFMGKVGALGRGLTGQFTGAVGGIFHGGKAGLNSDGIVKAISSGQQAQAKFNLTRAQNHLSGSSVFDRVGSSMNSLVGNVGSYQWLESAVSSYSDIKSDIDGDDNVKYADSALNAAWNHYVENNGAGTFEEWKNGTNIDSGTLGSGDTLSSRLDAAKQTAWNNLYTSNDSFKAKVNMHNRRFNTNYNGSSRWSTVNADRKNASAELEKRRAQKPKS